MIGCKTCGKQLSERNRTGWCRQHYAAANNGGEKWSNENRARWADPVMRAKILVPLRQYNRDRLLWCPLEYRDEYRRLTRVKHFSAADARAMIEATIARHLRAYLRTGGLQQSRLAA